MTTVNENASVSPEAALETAQAKAATGSRSYQGHLRVWRGDAEGGELVDYNVEVNEGEVVLDIIHRLQATQAGDLAVRWNCKAGKCGSCSAEINGRPRLMCMTRMSTFAPDEIVTVMVSLSSKVDIRVMHPSRGLPLISIDHEPHLPALQFQRTARSPAWVAWRRWIASRTTSPSSTATL